MMFTGVGTNLRGEQGDYMLIEEIARGGMGAIYKAEDRNNERIVAVKEACLDPAECEGKLIEIRKRLLQEMSALKPLDYPNIPKIFDQFSSANNEYLVMEFIEGNTLMKIQRQALKQKLILEEARVVGWAIQILDALTYLHELPSPIVHRDIKPDNLILSPDGRVMLVDFGLMKQIESELQISEPLIRAIGTVEYAPIEQYADSGGTTDARSDIYSLGATMYYLLCGQLPPKALDRVMPMSVDITKEPPPIRPRNHTVTKRLEQIVLKALAFAPENRFQTAREMREALLPPRRFILLPF